MAKKTRSRVPEAAHPAAESRDSAPAALPVAADATSAEPASHGPAPAAAVSPHWLQALAAAAALALVALALPDSGSVFPTVRVLTTLVTLAAIGLALGGSWLARRPDDKFADALLVGSVALALLSLGLRDATSGLDAWTAPLQTPLFGMQPAVLAAISAAGAIALGLAPASLSARTVLAAGTFGLWLVAFLPVGWVGSSTPAVWGALTGVLAPVGPQGTLAATALAGPTMTLAHAAVATGVLVLLATSRDLSRTLAWGAASALLLLPVAWPLVASHPAPGVALHVAGVAGLAAVALALVLHRWGERGLSVVTRNAEVLVFTVLLIAFLVLKTNGLRYSTTDEAIYFYAARSWTEGLWPYRDFFFAHPPLHIAVPALLYLVLGSGFLVGKWLSVAAATVAGVFVWRMARRFLGVWPGLTALALYWTSCEVLQASTNLTGINLTTAWMMAGLWAVFSRRFLLGGLLLGAAASTGFYGVGGYLAAVVLAAFLPLPPAATVGEPVWRRLLRHPGTRLTLGFLAVWGTLNLFFLWLAGDAYIQGAYTYHFAKKAKVPGFSPPGDGPVAILSNFFLLLDSGDFTKNVYYHAAHWWLALLAPLGVVLTIAVNRARHHVQQVRALADAAGRRTAAALPSWELLWNPRAWWRQPAEGGFTLLIWAVALALVIEFGQFKERYDFYYALLMPTLAMAAASWMGAVARLVKVVMLAESLPTSADQEPTRPFTPTAGWGVVTVGAVLLTMAWVPVNMAANRKAFPSEFKAVTSSKGLGERLEFPWIPAPGPAVVDELSHALFWQGVRLRGSIESGVHHYLWNKKRWWSTAEEMAAYVRANTTEQDTITGASDYAPLIAMLSGRRLAGNEVDTNSKVFNTGMVTPQEFWTKVCDDHVKFFVAAPMSYFAPQSVAKRPFERDNFLRDKVFVDRTLKHWKTQEIELWVRKAQPPAPACVYMQKPKPDAAPDKDGADGE
jgi:hypothetical protein